MSKINRKQDALDYHSQGRPGKIEVVATKPTNSQRDLALAYSPGVAEPCLKIAENKEDVYKYTAKGNLVAVISNGTAVLGLGNIGPEHSKSLLDVHATQYSQQGMGWEGYGCGQAWRAWTIFEYVQNLRDEIMGLAEYSKHSL